jgi:hypothetical protein
MNQKKFKLIFYLQKFFYKFEKKEVFLSFSFFSEIFKTGSECLLKNDPSKLELFGEFFGFEKEKKEFFFFKVDNEKSVCR